MPAIVAFPQIVQEALQQFSDLFSCAPQRRHFAEYLTGLMVATNKTVSGVSHEFVETSDQSCLNRFLTEVDWDVEKLNERRLQLLQQDPTTHYHEQGVIAIDDVLIDHDGKFIQDVGWFWDHAEERSKIAHDYLCVQQREALSSGIPSLQETRAVRSHRRDIRGSRRLVPATDRLGVRARHPRRFHV